MCKMLFNHDSAVRQNKVFTSFGSGEQQIALIPQPGIFALHLSAVFLRLSSNF